MAAALPLAQVLPPTALRILSRANQFETKHGDTRIVWHAWGEADHEPLVLLHGGSGSWTHWVRNVEPLASSDRRVLVPDLPGFGDSQAAKGIVDADGMVEPVADGLLQVVGREGFDVVGFSFGGMLAGLIAAKHQKLLRRIILAGAPALGLPSREMKLKDWRHLTDREEREVVHRHNLRELLIHAPESIDEFAVQLHSANMDRDRMRRRRLARTDVLAQALATLSCRVDGVWGEFDQLYAGRLGELHKLLRSFPTFEELEVIPSAGHWVQFEAGSAFNGAIIRLLELR